MKKYMSIALALIGIALVARVQETDDNTILAIDPFKNIMPIREGGLLHLGQKDLTEQEFVDGIKRIPNPDVVNVIVLANNKFETIKKSYFEPFKNLTHLNVSHNNIATIEDGAFEDLPLIEINLSHNMIPEINKKTLDGCKEVKDLNLSYNQITEINKEAFHSCKEMEHLNLVGNPIATKEKIMRSLKKQLPKKTFLLIKPA